MNDEFKPIKRMSLDEAVILKLLSVAACDYELAAEARDRERKILGIKDTASHSLVEALGVQDIITMQHEFLATMQLSDGWSFIGKPSGKRLKLKTPYMKKEKLMLSEPSGDNPPTAPPPKPPEKPLQKTNVR
jgi:hypothetical protein